MNLHERMTLHERIALALGWTVEQAKSFSLLSLRDLVRPVSPKLADEITNAINSPGYYSRPAPAGPKVLP